MSLASLIISTLNAVITARLINPAPVKVTLLRGNSPLVTEGSMSCVELSSMPITVMGPDAVSGPPFIETLNPAGKCWENSIGTANNVAVNIVAAAALVVNAV
jgi:hypothetical protein